MSHKITDTYVDKKDVKKISVSDVKGKTSFFNKIVDYKPVVKDKKVTLNIKRLGL